MICQQVETVDDYDEYCHYAAGLVGLGMSKLLLSSELETVTPNWEQLSNSTGLFLQVCMYHHNSITWKLWNIYFGILQKTVILFARKQTSSKITLRTLMKYQNHACFGLVRLGENMLTNSRCIHFTLDISNVKSYKTKCNSFFLI